MNKRKRRERCAMRRRVAWCVALVAAVIFAAAGAVADEPYGRSRQYDLLHVKAELSFAAHERKVMGEVTHTIAALREGLAAVEFDAVELTIEGVEIAGKPVKFATAAGKLVVHPAEALKKGQKVELKIRYHGRPRRGCTLFCRTKFIRGGRCRFGRRGRRRIRGITCRCTTTRMTGRRRK